MKKLCQYTFIILFILSCNDSSQTTAFDLKLDIEKYQNLHNSIEYISVVLQQCTDVNNGDSIKNETNQLITKIDHLINNILYASEIENPLQIDIWNTDIDDDNYFKKLKNTDVVSDILKSTPSSNNEKEKVLISDIKTGIQNQVTFLRRQLTIPHSSSFFHSLDTKRTLNKHVKLTWKDQFVGLSVIQMISELKTIQLELKKAELQTLEIVNHFLTQEK